MSASRPTGFSAGAIPASEILLYGQALGFEDLQELLDRVRACDRVFLEWLATHKPVAAGSQNAGPGDGRQWIPLQG